MRLEAIYLAFQGLLQLFGFEDTNLVRTVMMSTKAVISGSAALAVLHPNRFAPQSLEFFVPSIGLAKIIRLFLRVGYTIDTPQDRLPQYMRPGDLVITFSLPRSSLYLQVVVVTTGHVLSAITQSESTLTMNYIAHYGVVSLYPQWTMALAGLILPFSYPSSTAIEKYSSHGCLMTSHPSQLPHFDPSHICGQSIDCPKTIRHLYDDHVLYIPFMMGIRLSEMEPVSFPWSTTACCPVSDGF